jgi:hypothetical protein
VRHDTRMLLPMPGFDWTRVAWGRPDSPVRGLCSYCHGPLPECPLILTKRDGLTAMFCDTCTETWWGMSE